MRVVSGMVNKMEIRRERLRDGAKLRVALAAQVVKRKIARLQRRAQIGLSGKGHLRCSWADVNWDNKTIGLELTGDIATSDGTILAVKVYCNDDWARAWYDSSGMMLWDKFHFESTF